MFTEPVRKTANGSRAMTQEEIDCFLQTICYGTMSYTTSDGWPDSRVLNFTYRDNAFYFHANKARGEKLQHWCDDMRVCISFFSPSPSVGKLRLCQHESLLVYGRLHRVDDPEDWRSCPSEAYHALESLSFSGGTPHKALPERLPKFCGGCSVYRVDPEYIAGKLTIFTSLPEDSYLETIIKR